MTMMRAIRPVFGKTVKPNGFEVRIPINKEIRHIGGDQYRVSQISGVKIDPPTVAIRDVIFTISPWQARTDLEEVK